MFPSELHHTVRVVNVVSLQYFSNIKAEEHFPDSFCDGSIMLKQNQINKVQGTKPQTIFLMNTNARILN